MSSSDNNRIPPADGQTAAHADQQPVSGSGRAMVPGAHALGPADPREQVEVTLRLRPGKNAIDLATFVAQQAALPPAERVYLSVDELNKQNAADPADVEAVKAFAQQNGLTVVSASLPERNVKLAGTAEAMNRAFGVKLMRYSSPEGEYRGRIGDVRVPPDLQDVVEGVFGLDNRRQARPHVQRLEQTEKIIASVKKGNGKKGNGQAHAAAGGPLEARDVATLYHFPAGLDGTNQCIGILEFGGGYAKADLDSYFTARGMTTPQVIAVSVDKAKNHPSNPPANEDVEVALDIEVAGAVAPKAKIAVYFSHFTERGWVDALSAAVHDTTNRPSVLSISWGFTEGQLIWTQQAVDAVNQSLLEAAATGMTVCCAAGDDGSRDQLDDGHAHVDFPAGSPYVLACGGTRLVGAGGKIASETVWNDGPGSAGGGGISDMNPLPQWQQGIVPPSVNPDHHIGRGVPDVTGNGDPQTGYKIVVGGAENVVGGTSAVAPLWAGLIACFNQRLGKPVGFLNPLLYSKISQQKGTFHDITVGTTDDTGHIGGYSAGLGWDAASGWGSPDGTNLLAAIAALQTAAMPAGTSGTGTAMGGQP